MKTEEQEQRALAQRQANIEAQASGMPLPYPNPWDSFIERPAETASQQDRLAWHRAFAAQHAPGAPARDLRADLLANAQALFTDPELNAALERKFESERRFERTKRSRMWRALAKHRHWA
jgi:hypothetical protein